MNFIRNILPSASAFTLFVFCLSDARLSVCTFSGAADQFAGYNFDIWHLLVYPVAYDSAEQYNDADLFWLIEYYLDMETTNSRYSWGSLCSLAPSVMLFK